MRAHDELHARLTELGARLLADGQTARLLGLLLDQLRARGLLGKAVQAAVSERSQ